jgi:sugar/nucleoside kinase (ribokinase family)
MSRWLSRSLTPQVADLIGAAEYAVRVAAAAVTRFGGRPV